MNRPAIMGILNLTPDSFSGDGVAVERALKRAWQLVEEGADILDIGAESTRPGATALTPEEEWQRLSPVLAAVAAVPWRDRVRLSVDSYHAETIARVMEWRVDLVNDVGGLSDKAMGEALAERACDVVVMHALGIPADAAITLPPQADVIAEILQWKAQVIDRADAWGIASHRLIFDPGIGFGKTPQQSLTLIKRAAQLKASGGRWLYGHSRKSFLKLFTDAPPEGRDALTREFSKNLAVAGIDYLRVHDVAGHVAMFDASGLACT